VHGASIGGGKLRRRGCVAERLLDLEHDRPTAVRVRRRRSRGGGRCAARRVTGAGEDHGIDHQQNWLRFPYDSTCWRAHDLHPHPDLRRRRARHLCVWGSAAQVHHRPVEPLRMPRRCITTACHASDSVITARQLRCQPSHQARSIGPSEFSSPARKGRRRPLRAPAGKSLFISVSQLVADFLFTLRFTDGLLNSWPGPGGCGPLW
jgi:hypothetical protein